MPNATELLDLLAVRHGGDVFVAECKNGSSAGYHQRLDAWTMKKSWAHPLVIGYEIKISRSDFLKDDKWRGYLPYCNQFYFVVPSGMVQKEEVGAEAGLLVASKNITRLYAKKKAPYREVVIPEDLYRYILFCRAVITREHIAEGNTKAFWERWLADREDDATLGGRVGKRLQEMIKTRIHAVEEKNRWLAKEIATYEEIREVLERLGFKVDDYFCTNGVERRIAQLQEAVPRELLRDIESAEQSLATVREALEAIQAETRMATTSGEE